MDAVTHIPRVNVAAGALDLAWLTLTIWSVEGESEAREGMQTFLQGGNYGSPHHPSERDCLHSGPTGKATGGNGGSSLSAAV